MPRDFIAGYRRLGHRELSRDAIFLRFKLVEHADDGDRLRASLERERLGLDELADFRDVAPRHARVEGEGARVRAQHAHRDGLSSDRTHVLSVSQAEAEQGTGSGPVKVI